MLAVMLTKSFRCLCFIGKCTYSYFSVYYLKSVFLVQPVCRLPTSSLLSKGPFQRYKSEEETLDLCKQKELNVF